MWWNSISANANNINTQHTKHHIISLYLSGLHGRAGTWHNTSMYYIEVKVDWQSRDLRIIAVNSQLRARRSCRVRCRWSFSLLCCKNSLSRNIIMKIQHNTSNQQSENVIFSFSIPSYTLYQFVRKLAIHIFYFIQYIRTKSVQCTTLYTYIASTFYVLLVYIQCTHPSMYTYPRRQSHFTRTAK